MDRKITRQTRVGSVPIGGGAPVAIQSMTNTRTADIAATVAQINALEKAGCMIARMAVLDMEDARAFAEIKKQVRLPLIADIHFDYRLALAAIEHGADKIRINPGNIGSRERLKAVADACRDKGIPIRVGVNSGSLEKDILEKHGHPTAEALVESALRNCGYLEEMGFEDLVVSIKSSDVMLGIEAYRLASERLPYPLHLGVTEAGTVFSGTIKSAVGIGTLLAEGIGDTFRVSLTDDPVEEIKVARGILRSLGMDKQGVDLVACPTCGRTRIDLIGIAKEVERKLSGIDLPIKVAVMGCAVNGPGEAREADIGIAGGDGVGLIFKKGVIVKKVPEAALVDELMSMIDEMAARMGKEKD